MGETDLRPLTQEILLYFMFEFAGRGAERQSYTC